MSAVAWLTAPRQRNLLLLAVALEIALIVVTYLTNYRQYMDTEIYRLGAEALLSGDSLYSQNHTTVTGYSLPFIYPPFAALLFVPLTWLPLGGAIVLVAVISHLAIVATAYAIARATASLASRAGLIAVGTAVIMPLITGIEPVRETINYGQINIILMGLVALDCLLPRTKWPRGLLVGLAAGIKLTPLAFLLLFLLRKDFRSTAVAVVTFAATVAIGAIAAPREAADWWFDKMLATGDSFGAIYAGNLTVRSLLAKNELTGLTLNAWWIVGSLLLFVVAVVGMRGALRAGQVSVALMVNAVLALLISPISWSHHWVWIGPAVAVIGGIALRQRRHGVLAAAIGWLAVAAIGPQWLVPHGDEQELSWNFWQQVVGNSYTLIGIAFLIAVAVVWRTSGPVGDTGDAGQEGAVARS